jgi:hypothetical protein
VASRLVRSAACGAGRTSPVPPPTSWPPPTSPPVTPGCARRPPGSSGRPARRGAASRPRTGAGDALRTAAWCLYRCQPRHSPGTLLLDALLSLARAIAALRQAQRRLAQAEAALAAAKWIRAPATVTAFRPQRPAGPVNRAARRATARRPAAAGAGSAAGGTSTDRGRLPFRASRRVP